MSRAGEGKNESSAGKRVIVAKGSGGQGRTGQGRKARCHWRWIYWLVAIGWSLSRRHVGHADEATKYCSVFPEGYCSANINASGRAEVIGGGGLEEGRVMPREQLLPDTPVAGWALTLMYVRSGRVGTC